MSHLRVVAAEQIEVMNNRGQAYAVAKAWQAPFSPDSKGLLCQI